MGKRIPTNSERPVPYKESNTVQGQFDRLDGSKEYKERILYFIKNLLIQYKEKTQEETQKFDKEFIRNFRDDFKKLITDYIDNFGSNIDLEGIIKQVSEDDKYINSITNEIKGILKSLFKEEGFIQNNEDDSTFENNLNSSINKLFDSTNISKQQIDSFSEKIVSQLDGFKSSLVEQMEKNTDNLINEFRGNILSKNKKNKDDDKEQNTKIRRKNPFKIDLDPYTKIFGSKTVKKMIGYIAFSSYKKMFVEIGKFFKTLWKFSSKALDLSVKMISGIMSFTFGLVVKGLINPLYKMIAAPVGLIIRFTGTIISTLTGLLSKIVSGKAIQMMLLTPTGMYALGFFLGFLWGKIEKTLGISDNDNTNSQDDSLSIIEKKIKKLNDTILGVYNSVKKQWEGSELRKRISTGKKKISDIFNNIKENGLYEGLRNINDTTQMIFDVVIDPVKTVGEFCIKHWKLLATLGTAVGIVYQIVKSAAAIKMITSIVGIPLKVAGVGFFPALASALIAYGSAKATEAFLEECFGSKSNRGLNYVDEEIQRAYKIRGFRHERGLDFKKRNELSLTEQLIDEEIKTINRLKTDLGYILTLTDNGNDINQDDLEHIKDLAKEVFDSDFYSDAESKSKFISTDTEYKDKLSYLTEALSNRIENVIALQNTLNVGSNEQVEQVLTDTFISPKSGQSYIKIDAINKPRFVLETFEANSSLKTYSGKNYANIDDQFVKDYGYNEVKSSNNPKELAQRIDYIYTTYDKPATYAQEIIKKFGQSDKYKKYSWDDRNRKAWRYVSAHGLQTADIYRKLISGNGVEEILDEIEDYDLQQQKKEQEEEAKKQQDINKLKKDTYETQEKTRKLNEETQQLNEVFGVTPSNSEGTNK